MNSVAKLFTCGDDPRYAVRYCRISSLSVSVMQNDTRVRSSDPLSFCICSLHHASRVGVIRPLAPKLSTSAAFLEDFRPGFFAPAGVVAVGLFHAAAFCVARPATTGAGVTTAAALVLAAPPQAVLPPEAAMLAHPPPPPWPPPPPPVPILTPCSFARRAASRASSCWISDMDFLRLTLGPAAAAPPHAGAGGAAGSAGSGAA
mmetsp:Transcript_12962/g.28162  ORF Transcript_12962/g.28162 Transcript_12962/m.28162 type:complete len:203 (-) Transcript_12962:293-901(-)